MAKKANKEEAIFDAPPLDIHAYEVIKEGHPQMKLGQVWVLWSSGNRHDYLLLTGKYNGGQRTSDEITKGKEVAAQEVKLGRMRHFKHNPLESLDRRPVKYGYIWNAEKQTHVPVLLESQPITFTL